MFQSSQIIIIIIIIILYSKYRVQEYFLQSTRVFEKEDHEVIPI